jgi:hypothetical protein
LALLASKTDNVAQQSALRQEIIEQTNTVPQNEPVTDPVEQK